MTKILDVGEADPNHDRVAASTGRAQRGYRRSGSQDPATSRAYPRRQAPKISAKIRPN